MKKYCTALLLLISSAAFSQQANYVTRDSIIKDKVKRAVAEETKFKGRHSVSVGKGQTGVGIKPVFNKDSAEASFKPLYDSLVAAITYIESDGVTKTDTCIMYIFASNIAIIEDFDKLKAYGMRRYTERFVGVPEWKVTDAYRPRNRKTLNKNRIIEYKLLPNMTPAQARSTIIYRPKIVK